MDAGGLSHMTYDQYSNGGFAPSNGFASRPRAGNTKRLSVALPPKVNSIAEGQVDVQTPRTTSRSHLLAGLRTAPKNANPPASAPYSQSRHNIGPNPNAQWATSEYDSYSRGVPQTAVGGGFGANQYAMQAGQQTYALPEQVLAPPSFYEDDEEMDPNVLEQLQMTGLFLAQRQQQLQQQLASITAAANQFQNLDIAAYQQHMSLANLTQQAQEPIQVPGQPGLFIVQNPLTGQYQYVQANVPQTQQRPTQLGRAQTMHNLPTSYADSSRPVFRAEISPPPADKPVPAHTRSISPPTKTRSPQSALEHVEPLPPPSANAFRRGHQKKPSLSLSNGQVSDGPKTSSAATFGSSRIFVPPTPMTGTFGPGAARAGEHPVRQPRGPPPLEELTALPTANHEGSKNFAARRRRRALNLVRASSVRRGASNPLSSASPTSESGMSLAASEEDEPGYYRKQSPIGSERSVKRGSQSSVDGSINGSAVQTPATEDSNVFDMSNFIKQLPTQVQQAPERRKMMLGVLSAAEKRKSVAF
ncbi:hypothetical protein K461DRAFT_292590 [Myriangium duriaei CBS 260.36]|uniref:Uncharacterized protein n=1 Tax=Myriangium duriaei CBS 260.36 TaxID=1168546 RepID=A0A9P4J7K3_9PEZI|nr:hypothetical protein K461DRAFT_292590 [Myriangium duriaei CBS 260.36]